MRQLAIICSQSLQQNAGQGNGSVVFGVMLVFFLKYRAYIGVLPF